MSSDKSGPQISNVGELLTHAYQMELEAQARYTYLAAQMDLHNNSDLAGLFRKLAEVEGLHAKDIVEQIQDMGLPEPAPGDEKEWPDQEAPETIDLGDVDYMMTSRQALELALAAERRAQTFFEDLKAATSDSDVERFAAEFAEEEREHVELVLAEMHKYPASEKEPRDDMDPPIAQG